MKLFEVTNGYTGECYVRLLVVADNEKRALDIARPLYRQVNDSGHYKSDKYWKNLEATELCSDTSKEWCDSAIDG